LAAPGFLWAYRRSSTFAVGLYLALFTWWVTLQSIVWRFGQPSLSVLWVGGVGALLILAAEAHRPGNRLGIPYRVWGALLAAGSLIPLSSWSFWRFALNSQSWHPTATESIYQVLIPGIGFAILTFVGVGLCYRTSTSRGLVPAALLGLMVGLAVWSLVLPNDWIGAVVAIVLANLAMISLSLYLINVGAREERLRPFAAGVLYFLVWAIARYLDLFSMFGGMLGTAAVFVLCGVAILLIGRFWSQLKHLEPEVRQLATSISFLPTWVATLLNWVRPRRQLLIRLGVAFQLLFLVGMIAIESAPLVFGKTIMLRVRPIDPRDFFRGDYVILRYDINNLTPTGTPDLGAPVYVVIEPGADGHHWHGVSASFTRPTTGDYLIGRNDITSWGPGRYRFGIEAYYVQEGKGLAWEEAARRGNLAAEIAVAPWGQAKLRKLHIDNPAVPADNLLN